MKLTCLGNQGPYPGKEGACSGYLLEEAGFRLLLDCGTGVLPALWRICAPWEVDGVFLSHLHFDHFGDLLPLGYALADAAKRGVWQGKLPVCGPGEPAALRTILEGLGTLDYRPVRPGDTLDLPFPVTIGEAVHPVPGEMLRVGDAFVYSGDTRDEAGLAAFAAGADTLLADGHFFTAGWSAASPHLTAAAAARAARTAGVRRLLLTHFHPLWEPEALLAEARAEFPAAEAIQRGRSYNLPG